VIAAMTAGNHKKTPFLIGGQRNERRLRESVVLSSPRGFRRTRQKPLRHGLGDAFSQTRSHIEQLSNPRGFDDVIVWVLLGSGAAEGFE
jgi:hypothetical protein